jgi:Spy/CpxP family protein refolding chaperone
VKRWKVILGLSVLFLSGVLVGSMGAAIYFKKTLGHAFPKEQSQVRKFVMKKLVGELDLSEAQRASLEEIVGQVQTDLWKFRKEHQKEVETIVVEGIIRMKPVLNPIQQEKLDGLFQRLKAHWERLPEGHRR